MTSFLPSNGRSLDCLLPEPRLRPQSVGVGEIHTVVKVVDADRRKTEKKIPLPNPELVIFRGLFKNSLLLKNILSVGSLLIKLISKKLKT